jgi:hypothetical protein
LDYNGEEIYKAFIPEKVKNSEIYISPLEKSLENNSNLVKDFYAKSLHTKEKKENYTTSFCFLL